MVSVAGGSGGHGGGCCRFAASRALAPAGAGARRLGAEAAQQLAAFQLLPAGKSFFRGLFLPPAQSGDEGPILCAATREEIPRSSM